MSTFYECIFLKKDSSMNARLASLRTNPRKYREEIHMLEMGIAGENQVMYHLSKSNIGMYAMRDINLSIGDFTAQIDFVVITSHHCYFIECKNYNANIIHVDENSNFEISNKYRGRYIRRGICSPLSQVDNQLNVLKKIFLNDSETAKNLLCKSKFKDYFKTIVVFTNPDNRLDLKKAPFETKFSILKVDNLIRQIEYDDKHYDGSRYCKEEMKAIADFIISKNVDVKSNILPNSLINDTLEINIGLSNNSLSSQDSFFQVEKKSKKKRIILIILIIYLLCALILNILGYGNSTKNNSTKKVALTDNQKGAVTTFKEAYKSSSVNGIEFINTSVCEEMSKLLGNGSRSFSCDRYPLIVNFINDNKLTIYKNYNCYTLELSEDGENIISSTYKYLGYDTNNECTGLPIAYLEWDETNEYYQKVGGIDKIKEMALYAYNGNGFVTDYYTKDFLLERGARTDYYTIYAMYVDMYFSALLKKGYSLSASSTRKEETNKMLEYLYYIMK